MAGARRANPVSPRPKPSMSGAAGLPLALPFAEQPLLLDLDACLLGLQRALALEVELQLLLGAARAHGLLLAPLLGLPVERHVAGEAANRTADEHAGRAVAEQ